MADRCLTKKQIDDGFEMLGLGYLKDTPFSSPEDFARDLVSKVAKEADLQFLDNSGNERDDA